jgi:hypothetical protein
VRFRPLLAVLALALLLGACSDDTAGDTGLPDATDAVPTTPEASAPPVTRDAEGVQACEDLAERYVRRARVLFTGQGTPSDDLVDQVRGRLEEFDTIASTAGCGAEYVQGVCAGLDGLTAEGILVIIPLTTAQCL